MIGDSVSPLCQHQACQCLQQPCAGIEHWIGDNYCDDENNNAACQFDGGDCCNNSMSNWDWYCTVSKKMDASYAVTIIMPIPFAS